MTLNQDVKKINEIVLNKEALVPLTFSGNPILKKTCEPLGKQLSLSLLHKLVKSMKKLMAVYKGVGLSANQIGLDLAMFVAEDLTSLSSMQDRLDERDFQELQFFAAINPKYIPLDEDGNEVEKVLPPFGGYDDDLHTNKLIENNIKYNTYFEGCLSFPGYMARRRRYDKVRLEYLDENLKKQTRDFSGWPARIVQHEVDHLNGELYTHRANVRTFLVSDDIEDYVYNDIDEPIEDFIE